MSILKSFIRKALGVFNLKLVRRTLRNDEFFHLSQVLKYNGVENVIDIGANEGQFAINLRKSGYKKTIVSFEPLDRVHSILLSNAKNDPLWHIYPPIALGDKNCSMDINVSENKASSSFLVMLSEHEIAAPESVYTGVEKVKVKTLDSVRELNPVYFKNFVIKLDVQGFEMHVLKGGQKTLEFATGVLVELSFVHFYAGQGNWKTIVEELDSFGFVPWVFLKGFMDKVTHQTYQLDVLFIKK